MNKKQVVYLVLAVLGAVAPWYYITQFVMQTGSLSFIGFFQAALQGGHASAALTVDICIAYLVFCIWSVGEAKRLGMRNVWFYIAWATLVAIASAFPLFLFFREKKILGLKANADSL